MKPPFAYLGGKTILADRIVNLLPEHRHYVEPFAKAHTFERTCARWLQVPPGHGWRLASFAPCLGHGEPVRPLGFTGSSRLLLVAHLTQGVASVEHDRMAISPGRNCRAAAGIQTLSQPSPPHLVKGIHEQPWPRPAGHGGRHPR